MTDKKRCLIEGLTKHIIVSTKINNGYCEACERYYTNIKTHNKSMKHKRNEKRKQNDEKVYKYVDMLWVI
jgi:hypothetical protein